MLLGKTYYSSFHLEENIASAVQMTFMNQILNTFEIFAFYKLLLVGF